MLSLALFFGEALTAPLGSPESNLIRDNSGAKPAVLRRLHRIEVMLGNDSKSVRRKFAPKAILKDLHPAATCQEIAMILTPASQKLLSQGLLDVLIRAGLVAILVIACYQVFHPFLNLMLWSVILAVTLYPLHRRLKPRLGNRDGRTATVLVLICIIVLLVPLYLLGVSLGSSVAHGMEVVRSGSFHIPPPPDSGGPRCCSYRRYCAIRLRSRPNRPTVPVGPPADRFPGA